MPAPPLLVRRPAARLAWLREARWLDSERLRAYARVFALATAVVLVGRFVMRLDADYLSFWAAGRLVLAGRPADAYNVDAHWAVERTEFHHVGYFGFFYPPVFLLLCAPLAILPFYWSLVVFLAGTLLAYLRTMRALLPRAGLALFGFPGVTMTLWYGQNGLLTTALFAGGLTALQRRRPALAGVCFGCLCYKPHLGLAVPLALLAVRQWRAFLAAGVTVVGLAGATTLAFGPGIWRPFLAGTTLARHTLEQGLVQNASWASTFRAVVQAGAGLTAAYAVQAAVSLAVVVALVLACRRRPDAITGLLPAAAVLTTPFLLAYDLALLAVPMAWVVAEARRTGFLPWEKAALGLAYVVPLPMLLGALYGLPLGPPAMLALFAVVLRRAWCLPAPA